MTDEQINAAIAEACGWTDFGMHPMFGLMGLQPGTHGMRTAIENYCTDLNAMHEAEQYLESTQWHQYALYLNKVCWHWALIHAPARVRAEALLRTLGKWEEAQDAN
jgi:hypothetical protein